MVQNITSINQEEIKKRYDVIFCDVWGVLHNGIAAFSSAVSALKAWKEAKKNIVFVTNSPRSSKSVIRQLKQLKITEDVFDAVITSGDATNFLVQQAPKKIYYIGTHAFTDILTIGEHSFVDESEAEVVLCTGLLPKYGQDLDLYRPLLQRLSERNLPFICANPDIFVDFGGEKQWCAGAVAKLYEEYGGKILIAGKPYNPIYDLALQAVLKVRNETEIEKSKILAIGDGLPTDILGAINFGIDCLFVINGIHQFEYVREQSGSNQNISEQALEKIFDAYGVSPTYRIERLG